MIFCDNRCHANKIETNFEELIDEWLRLKESLWKALDCPEPWASQTATLTSPLCSSTGPCIMASHKSASLF